MTTLEQDKLKIEIRILQQQEKWEFWKSLASTLIPVLALLSLLAGGWKYFKDETINQRLRRETVFAQGLGNIGSKDEFVRLGAVISMMSYVGQDKGFDGRIVAVLVIHTTNETSIIVKKTLISNLRKWKQEDRKLFDDFATNVNKELQSVAGDLGNAQSYIDERNALHKQKIILERAAKLLIELN